MLATFHLVAIVSLVLGLIVMKTGAGIKSTSKSYSGPPCLSLVMRMFRSVPGERIWRHYI